MNKFEQALWADGFRAVAGIDEAGRGPLAGPVVAAAVIFDPWCEPPAGIDDSKRLSPETRDVLYDKIYAYARSVGTGIVYQQEIDNINILQATFKAMKSAVSQLSVSPDHLLIDGNRAPDFDQPCTTIIKGDSQSVSIAAASIIAKVTRDREIALLKRKLSYDFGSGYMADPGTKRFVDRYWARYPNIFRHSWAPYKKLARLKKKSKLGVF